MTSVRVRLEWCDVAETGQTVYLIGGPRIRGAVTAAWIHAPWTWIRTATIDLAAASVQLTSGIATAAAAAAVPRPSEMHLNRVRLTGWTSISPYTLTWGARPGLHTDSTREPLSVYPTDWPSDLPETTGWYAAAVLDAVARHWTARPDTALRRAAAARAHLPAFEAALAQWRESRHAPSDEPILRSLADEAAALHLCAQARTERHASAEVEVCPRRP